MFASVASRSPTSVTCNASNPRSSERKRANTGGSWLSTRNFTLTEGQNDRSDERHTQSQPERPRVQGMDSPVESPECWLQHQAIQERPSHVSACHECTDAHRTGRRLS